MQVALRCSERLHELVREELERRQEENLALEWRLAMERSFDRMDKEVTAWNREAAEGAKCRCELRTPDCDAVGSTAVIAIMTPDKIVIANCGDSRAVLSRGGKAVALSSDHKVSWRFRKFQLITVDIQADNAGRTRLKLDVHMTFFCFD